MRQHLAHDAGQRRLGERAARREAHSRRRLRSDSDGRDEHRQLEREMREGVADEAREPLPAGLERRIAQRLRRRRNPATIRSSATSAMPPSRPRRRPRPQQHAIVAAAAPRRRRRGAARLPPSAPCAAASPARPPRAPRQAASHGQTAQAGRFGVQIVAPRSISACAKSPGRSAGTSACGEGADHGLCLRQRRPRRGTAARSRARHCRRPRRPARSNAIAAIAAAV